MAFCACRLLVLVVTLPVARGLALRVQESNPEALHSLVTLLERAVTVRQRNGFVEASRQDSRQKALEMLLARTALSTWMTDGPPQNLYGGIPKRIHSTWKSRDELSGQQRSYVKRWRHANQDCIYHFWNDSSVAEFLAVYAPQDAHMLEKMKNVELYDYFRYAVLNQFGGIYHDIDVYPLKPVGRWLEDSPNQTQARTRLITGWEGRCKDEEERVSSAYARINQVQQWTMAGSPGHPVLKRALRFIRNNFVRNQTKNTLLYTGPGPWTDAVLSYIGPDLPPVEDTGKGRNQRVLVKDLALMERDAFGTDGKVNYRDSVVLVQHTYLGSWKEEGWDKDLDD